MADSTADIDMKSYTFSADTIAESTGDAGVTVDGCLIKDGGIAATSITNPPWLDTAGGVMHGNIVPSPTGTLTLGSNTNAWLCVYTQGIGNDSPVLMFDAGATTANFTGNIHLADGAHIDFGGVASAYILGKWLSIDIVSAATVSLIGGGLKSLECHAGGVSIFSNLYLSWGGNVYLGANGIGYDAAVLTFDAGATGTAMFAGGIRVPAAASIDDGGSNILWWNAASTNLWGRGTPSYILNFYAGTCYFYDNLAAELAHIDATALSMSKPIYLGANGIGNNASVLTFGATGAGLATFGGGVVVSATGGLTIGTTDIVQHVAGEAVKINAYCAIGTYATYWATFGNAALAQVYNYAMIQLSDGTSYFNCATGTAMYFRVENNAKMTMTGTALTMAIPLYVGANGIGNNASVLTFAAGGDGMATFAGPLTVVSGPITTGGLNFSMASNTGITCLSAATPTLDLYCNNVNVLSFIGTAATFVVPVSIGGNLSLLADNRKAIFGGGSDATIYYDGSNMILDPNEVGTGKVYVGATANDSIAAAGYYFGTSTVHWIDVAAYGMSFHETGYHATIPCVYIRTAGLLVARGGIECSSRTNISTLDFGRQSEGAGAGAYIQETRNTAEFKIGVNVNCGIQLILTHTSNILQDHDHATPTNPTLYLHSVTAPDTNNTQWMSLTHDQTNGVLAVGTGSIVLSNNTIIGVGAAATDYTLTFDGETNDGVLTWRQATDYFEVGDDILMSTTERVYFRDTAISIYSANDGYLDLVADTAFRFNTGNVFVLAIKSGATQVAAGAAAGEVWKTAGHASLPDNVLMIGV